MCRRHVSKVNCLYACNDIAGGYVDSHATRPRQPIETQNIGPLPNLCLGIVRNFYWRPLGAHYSDLSISSLHGEKKGLSKFLNERRVGELSIIVSVRLNKLCHRDVRCLSKTLTFCFLRKRMKDSATIDFSVMILMICW